PRLHVFRIRRHPEPFEHVAVGDEQLVDRLGRDEDDRRAAASSRLRRRREEGDCCNHEHTLHDEQHQPWIRGNVGDPAPPGNWRETAETATSFLTRAERTNSHWSALFHAISSQSPSGDQARSLNWPPPRKTCTGRMRSASARRTTLWARPAAGPTTNASSCEPGAKAAASVAPVVGSA